MAKQIKNRRIRVVCSSLFIIFVFKIFKISQFRDSVAPNQVLFILSLIVVFLFDSNEATVREANGGSMMYLDGSYLRIHG